MTNPRTKSKYFDELWDTLSRLTNTINQDCPDENRSDELNDMIWKSYNLLSEIYVDSKSENQNDEQGSISIAL